MQSSSLFPPPPTSIIKIGLGTEFRSEKILRNRHGTPSVIPRKKVLIPSSTEEPILKIGTQWNSAEKISFTEQQQNNLTKWFVWTSKVVFSELFFEIFCCRVLFCVVFSSGECFGMAFLKFVSFFVPQNGILSCVLFHRMVRNGIPRVCFYFCSTEWNSELFSFPQKDSERNSDSLLLFFHRTEFQVVFSSAEVGFGTELWECASIFFHGTEFRVVFSSAEGLGTEF